MELTGPRILSGNVFWEHQIVDQRETIATELIATSIVYEINHPPADCQLADSDASLRQLFRLCRRSRCYLTKAMTIGMHTQITRRNIG